MVGIQFYSDPHPLFWLYGDGPRQITRGTPLPPPPPPPPKKKDGRKRFFQRVPIARWRAGACCWRWGGTEMESRPG